MGQCTKIDERCALAPFRVILTSGRGHVGESGDLERFEAVMASCGACKGSGMGLAESLERRFCQGCNGTGHNGFGGGICPICGGTGTTVQRVRPKCYVCAGKGWFPDPVGPLVPFPPPPPRRSSAWAYLGLLVILGILGAAFLDNISNDRAVSRGANGDGRSTARDANPVAQKSPDSKGPPSRPTGSAPTSEVSTGGSSSISPQHAPRPTVILAAVDRVITLDDGSRFGTTWAFEFKANSQSLVLPPIVCHDRGATTIGVNGNLRCVAEGIFVDLLVEARKVHGEDIAVGRARVPVSEIEETKSLISIDVSVPDRPGDGHFTVVFSLSRE